MPQPGPLATLGAQPGTPGSWGWSGAEGGEAGGLRVEAEGLAPFSAVRSGVLLLWGSLAREVTWDGPSELPLASPVSGA